MWHSSVWLHTIFQVSHTHNGDDTLPRLDNISLVLQRIVPWKCKLNSCGCLAWSILCTVPRTLFLSTAIICFLCLYTEWPIRLSVAYPSSSVHYLVCVFWQLSPSLCSVACSHSTADYAVLACLNAGDPHWGLSCTVTTRASSMRCSPSGRGGCLSPGSLQRMKI